VFPVAGRWSLTARAGGSTSRLGSVLVRPAPRTPLVLSEPTTIELEPSGTLLVVENAPGRLLRVDPARGTVAEVVPTLTRPFAVVRAPSGAILVTSANVLRTSEGATVAEANGDIGPVTVAAGGDIYFSTATRIFRLPGGAGPPVSVAGTGAEGGGGDGGPASSAQFRAPHGLSVAADGALLVADTGNDRVRRIDLSTGVITKLADVGDPGGIDVAADGTIYVAEMTSRRVLHLTAAGARIGFVGPEFGLPYDVEVAADGVVYLLEAGPVGKLQRIAADGTVTRVSVSRG
jgi:sugar lactone lactonase YvrE